MCVTGLLASRIARRPTLAQFLTKSLHFGVLTSARRARILLVMAKDPTTLTVESAVKREARLAAGRRLISLSEYTEIAWAAAIEAEARAGPAAFRATKRMP